MKGSQTREGQLREFRRYLEGEERERGTVEKYIKDAGAFLAWLGPRALTKEAASGWKEHLRGSALQPETVNSKLAALNKFLAFRRRPECRVRYLKIQRKLFRGPERELTRPEYQRLLETARSLGKVRLALLIETICATGIRVSEVRCITAEAVAAGRADVALKGKVRTILLPGRLCRKLEKYAKKPPPPDLGGDEGAVRKGGGSALQGIPPQPAPPLCTDLLPGLPRRGQAGGRAGPLQHGDHPHLPGLHRRGACAPAGPAGPYLLIPQNKQNA